MSRALLWKGLLELVLAWLPLIIHALHSKLWPQIWQEGSGLQSEFSLAQLPPLAEEAIENGQLRPVSQHLLFPSWFFLLFSFPTLSLSTLPPTICPAHTSFTSWVVFCKLYL